jgi:hypothetical protein
MKKIGEYANHKQGRATYARVEVFETKKGKLRVWDSVTMVAGMIISGRHILDFATGNYIHTPAFYGKGDLIDLPIQNYPAEIITDPALWVLGKNKSKNNP